MDLCKKILLKIEATHTGKIIYDSSVEIYTKEQVAYYYTKPDFSPIINRFTATTNLFLLELEHSLGLETNI